jgi:hypothetical protein
VGYSYHGSDQQVAASLLLLLGWAGTGSVMG